MEAQILVHHRGLALWTFFLRASTVRAVGPKCGRKRDSSETKNGARCIAGYEAAADGGGGDGGGA